MKQEKGIFSLLTIAQEIIRRRHVEENGVWRYIIKLKITKFETTIID